MPDPKEQQPPQGARTTRPAPEPKPDPSVEAPAFVWVNKGYDPPQAQSRTGARAEAPTQERLGRG